MVKGREVALVSSSCKGGASTSHPSRCIPMNKHTMKIGAGARRWSSMSHISERTRGSMHGRVAKLEDAAFPCFSIPSGGKDRRRGVMVRIFLQSLCLQRTSSP